jgi:hypothetical protein
MNKNRRLFHLWRNLRFWQRLFVECAFCLVVTLSIGLLIFRSSVGEAVFDGLFTGTFLAIIDHAFFAPKRKNKPPDQSLGRG